MTMRMLKITMPESDWIEVYYALETKLHDVTEGLYGYALEDSDDIADPQWIACLQRARDAVEKALEEAEIPF